MTLADKKWFRIMIGIILFLLIIFLVKLNDFLLVPLFVIVQTMFLPIVVAGILYYLCRPLVSFLVRKKSPKWFAILAAYLAIVLVIYGFIRLISPVINEQLETFIDNLPAMVSTVTNWINYVQEHRNIFPDFVQEAIQNAGADFEQKVRENIGNIASGIISAISVIGGIINTVFVLILVPFILFYMLKDGHRFVEAVCKWFPKGKREKVKEILHDMDKTIALYIQGQMFVSLIVGILLYIGYLIIDLNYSLVLAVFGMLTNVIPFLGPYIAVIPAMLVALFQDPIMVIYVAIIMLVAQQIEGNIISPNVMGKSLNIHPLTIIVLILTAGNLVGIIGVIFVIPFYSVVKVLVIHIGKIFRYTEDRDESITS